MLKKYKRKEKGFIVEVDTRKGKVITNQNDMVHIVKSDDGRNPRGSTLRYELFKEEFKEVV